MTQAEFKNPYRPGAGHMPPHLAGREDEFGEFKRLLDQDVILENMVLTGLRGVGKTVLLDKFKPRAIEAGWLWVGTDLSETASLTETHLARRLLVDLSVVTSSFTVPVPSPVGFHPRPGRIADPSGPQILDTRETLLRYARTALRQAESCSRIRCGEPYRAWTWPSGLRLRRGAKLVRSRSE